MLLDSLSTYMSLLVLHLARMQYIGNPPHRLSCSKKFTAKLQLSTDNHLSISATPQQLDRELSLNISTTTATEQLSASEHPPATKALNIISQNNSHHQLTEQCHHHPIEQLSTSAHNISTASPPQNSSSISAHLPHLRTSSPSQNIHQRQPFSTHPNIIHIPVPVGTTARKCTFQLCPPLSTNSIAIRTIQQNNHELGNNLVRRTTQKSDLTPTLEIPRHRSPQRALRNCLGLRGLQ